MDKHSNLLDLSISDNEMTFDSIGVMILCYKTFNGRNECRAVVS